MNTHYPHWEEEGTTWRAILDVAQSVAKLLARDWSAHVTREIWDSPTIDVRWHGRGIERSIRLLIGRTDNGYELRVSGSVWKDDENKHERKWLTLEDSNDSIPVPPEFSRDTLDTFRNNLRQTLKRTRKILLSKQEKHLDKRTVLPQRSFNLTIKAGWAKEKRRSPR